MNRHIYIQLGILLHKNYIFIAILRGDLNATW